MSYPYKVMEDEQVQDLLARKEQLLQERQALKADPSLGNEERSSLLHKLRHQLNKVNHKLDPTKWQRDTEKNKVYHKTRRVKKKKEEVVSFVLCVLLPGHQIDQRLVISPAAGCVLSRNLPRRIAFSSCQ